MADYSLSSKIDTLIRLQAHLAVAGLTSQNQKILFLGRVGLNTAEIADILGTTVNTVSVALSNARKDGSLKRSTAKSGRGKGEKDGKE
ncbi:sigma-70 family RNA polymerase sigma factor [Mesorhizobium sp. B4-1-3]|uniref:sigma factor-like helix-turn-helix DNA-binding protein n=1 Tax=Mesorhizobium sp. B4-1-3 TaxID=2589889 RepID=UPI0011276A06|nr:sigma factor-like helix-turn-helix DNA-binding protein [Mesorhizobium sp. B4-1-3]TPI13774.1 sigma-70 family RNA polymerase sigma factor [Mesorhizobium sp. B4-1-3]